MEHGGVHLHISIGYIPKTEIVCVQLRLLLFVFQSGCDPLNSCQPCSTSSPANGIRSLPAVVAGISHHGFNLHFPHDWWGWAPFHTCSYFSIECPCKPFAHFSVVFLSFSYWLARVLYLWWIRFLLLEMCIAVLGILSLTWEFYTHLCCLSHVKISLKYFQIYKNSNFSRDESDK